MNYYNNCNVTAGTVDRLCTDFLFGHQAPAVEHHPFNFLYVDILYYAWLQLPIAFAEAFNLLTLQHGHLVLDLLDVNI